MDILWKHYNSKKRKRSTQTKSLKWIDTPNKRWKKTTPLHSVWFLKFPALALNSGEIFILIWTVKLIFKKTNILFEFLNTKLIHVFSFWNDDSVIANLVLQINDWDTLLSLMNEINQFH